MAIQTYSYAKSNAYWADMVTSINDNGIFDGYFDTITENTTYISGTMHVTGIRFNIGTNVAMKIYASTNQMNNNHSFDIYIYTSSGAEYHFNYGGSGTHYIYKFTKTSNGVVINIATDEKKNDAIVVTKTDKGGIGFAVVKYPDNVDADAPMYCISYDDSLSVAEESTNLPLLVQESNVTILSYIACCDSPNGDYLPHCYLMRYSQQKGVQRPFIMNDVTYISNGYFCVEE